MDETGYAAPTPKVFYIHDDVSDMVRQRHGADSLAAHLTQQLFAAVRRDPLRVVVLRLDEQITRLLAQGEHRPFTLTLGLGQAGVRVAQQLHARTGWFPAIHRLDITREEDGRGAYRLVSGTPLALEAQLAALQQWSSVDRLAVVDDTVFSGLTMRTVLQALPTPLLARTRAFCLRGVAESLAGIRALCPLAIGFAATGRILEDVSFINASGMVLRGGIRRTGKPPLAFFERQAWMQAWFPGYADEVIALCRQLHALLESPGA